MDNITTKYGVTEVILSMIRRPMSSHARGFRRAEAIFKKHGGVLRTMAAIREGIHPRTLYAMRGAGVLQPLSRGIYRLAGMKPLAHPDIVTVALRVPKSVICLISALAFHELTSEIPHEVYIAVGRNAEYPRVDYPPTRIFRFSEPAFSAGIEEHRIDGFTVRIYGPEKTLADCFKYRNKLGIDVAIEALKRYRERRKLKVDDLLRYAGACRVSKIIRPYVEALI